MANNTKAQMLLMRAQCGCAKKLFPAGEEAWEAEARADAALTRSTLEIVRSGSVDEAMLQSVRDCPHDMRWDARYGLKPVPLAKFRHVDAVQYLNESSRPLLMKFGIGAGQAFFPGLLEGTLRECTRLGFNVDVHIDLDDGNSDGPPYQHGEHSVLVRQEHVAFGDDGTRAILAHGALLALGTAVARELAPTGRAVQTPKALMDVCRALHNNVATREHCTAPGFPQMVLTLYGTMAAHFLGLDLRIAAAALIIAERQELPLFGGFCASLADVRGRTFSTMGEMERALAPTATRDMWLTARTSRDRAQVIALASEALLRAMLQ